MKKWWLREYYSLYIINSNFSAMFVPNRAKEKLLNAVRYRNTGQFYSILYEKFGKAIEQDKYGKIVI